VAYNKEKIKEKTKAINIRRVVRKEYSNKFTGSKDICSDFNMLIGADISVNPTPINARPTVISRKAKMLNNKLLVLFLAVL
jgi:hypothetical protein